MGHESASFKKRIYFGGCFFQFLSMYDFDRLSKCPESCIKTKPPSKKYQRQQFLKIVHSTEVQGSNIRVGAQFFLTQPYQQNSYTKSTNITIIIYLFYKLIMLMVSLTSTEIYDIDGGFMTL